MTLGEKIRSLRTLEGSKRGLGRPLTQRELVEALQSSAGKTISQAYLSQLEKGTRPHLTNQTRTLLAKFFQVHPGYLVDDPDEVSGAARSATADETLDSWLITGAERFHRDPELSTSLLLLARQPDSRKCFLLVGELLRIAQ